MIPYRSLTLISGAGFLSWIAWLVVLYRLDPGAKNNPSSLAFALFFISLAPALITTFTVAGFYFRIWLNKKEIPPLTVALRQGVLLTLIALGCLLFQLLGVLTWWSGLLFIGGITAIEFYLMTKENS